MCEDEGQKPYTYRLWDDNHVVSPGLYGHLPELYQLYDAMADPWPVPAVETLLAAWGYDPDATGWQEVDPVLWYHLQSIYRIFLDTDITGSSPFERKAEAALDDYRAKYPQGDLDSPERKALVQEMLLEESRNVRWVFEYVNSWLDTGLRLKESRAAKQE
jgi:hypothetical protein